MRDSYTLMRKIGVVDGRVFAVVRTAMYPAQYYGGHVLEGNIPAHNNTPYFHRTLKEAVAGATHEFKAAQKSWQ